MGMNLYAALGLDREPAPSPADVKRAYRAAAKKAHPDHGGSKEKFSAIVKARDVLSDAERKAKYDRTGEIDEKAIDNTEADALNKAMAAIDFVFTECMRRAMRIEEVDVIADAVKRVKADLMSLAANGAQHRAAAVDARKTAKRFRNKGKGPNRISPMLEARALDAERNAEKLAEPVAVCKRAIEILNDHAFDVAPRSAGMGGMVVNIIGP
jgi:curved DNA-binding protein CbpA